MLTEETKNADLKPASLRSKVREAIDQLQSEDLHLRQAAEDWLIDMAGEIAEDIDLAEQALAALTGAVERDNDFDTRQRALKASKGIWKAGFSQLQAAALGQVESAVRSSDWEVRKAAADWMRENAAEIARNSRLARQAQNALIEMANQYREGKPDSRSASEAIVSLWEAGWKIEQDPQACEKIVLDQVLLALRESSVLELKRAAIDWLGDKTGEIAAYERVYTRVAGTLIALRAELRAQLKASEAGQNQGEKRAEVEQLWERTDLVLRGLWEVLAEDAYREQVKILQESTDENKRTTAIWRLADKNTLGSRTALRTLVDQWVEWVKTGQEPRLVELTAEAIRYNNFAVLALLEHFGKQTPTNGHQPGEEMEPGGEREELKRLQVDLRIARQLADMSDPAFFSGGPDGGARTEEHRLNLQELKKHAVPVMLRQLSSEDEGQMPAKEVRDSQNQICEHMVRMLGYTGGREAIDALARQVVGKERQRKARQELLDEYYLKPTLERGEQAAEILMGTIQVSKRTLRILQIINASIFAVGMVLLIGGLYFSMRGQAEASRVVGALSALGGFAGMIALLVKAPLDRIQTAMANLVHVETAFTSFIWSLNLNGTFIQSRYVKNGRLEESEIGFTAGQIEAAMEQTMGLVSTYTEEDEPRLVTRLHRLEPASGALAAAATISLYGQNLLGDSSQKKERKGLVAINHVPINAKILQWTEQAVRFQLPEETPAGEPAKSAWISLFVDGMETNALPYRVMRS